MTSHICSIRVMTVVRTLTLAKMLLMKFHLISVRAFAMRSSLVDSLPQLIHHVMALFFCEPSTLLLVWCFVRFTCTPYGRCYWSLNLNKMYSARHKFPLPLAIYLIRLISCHRIVYRVSAVVAGAQSIEDALEEYRKASLARQAIRALHTENDSGENNFIEISFRGPTK